MALCKEIGRAFVSIFCPGKTLPQLLIICRDIAGSVFFFRIGQLNQENL